MASLRASETRSLRERVLSASATLLESDGLSALSMREVARRAGLSHQAPYHCFPDREAILAALVDDGFDRLASRLRKVMDDVDASDPASAVVRMGTEYVGFALDHPGIFRVMFRSELVDLSKYPEALAAGARAFGELERLVQLLDCGASSEVQVSLQWAVVHGLASLLTDGALGTKLGSRRAQDEHVALVLRSFADGVVKTTARSPPKRRGR